MKADKAVCTDTMTDTEHAISYENLLSTLVQKKFLAIKRECDAKNVEKHKRKQKNCLGSLISGKRHGRSSQCEDGNDRPDENMVDNEKHNPSQSISQDRTMTDSKDNTLQGDGSHTVTITSNAPAEKATEHVDSTDVGINCVQANESNAKNEQIDESEASKCQIMTLNERISGNNDNNSIQTFDELRTDVIKFRRNVKNDPRNGEHQINSTENQHRNSDNCSTIERDIESPIAISQRCNSPSVVSHIEMSDEINAKQKFSTQKSSSDTISVPSLLKRTTSSAADDAMALHDQEQRHQVRLLEAKSISAQCSPIFAQRQTFNAASDNANRSPLPHRVSSMQNTSDDSVNVTFINSPLKKCNTTTDTMVKDDTIETDARAGQSQTMKSNRSSKTFFKKKDKVPKRSIANNEAHGFISSFNQLTANNLPVITSATTTMLKNLTSKKCERNGGHASGNSNAADNHGIIIDTNEPTPEQIRNKKAAKDELNKYRRTHRCSEPVLVYPSPNHLQHCILSMPPNQPIQLRYNDELMYDVSLQMETDRHNDFGSDRRRHRNHKHHHHHHHHHRHHHHHNGRKKRHKRKILVHDLDEQVVKVIDPEDMSQRARWTIIATACLLLLMCLLLVGVTLRMAPLIDDMVRQENERIQESINRGKYVRNITHAAFIGGQQYQQQSQQP